MNTSPPSIWQATIKQICPACGKASIFNGWLTIVDKCPECKTALDQYQTEDGPAFFVMLIVPILLIIAAVLVHAIYPIPIWAHLTLWIPLACVLSIYGLRIAKACLLSVQFKQKLKTHQ